MTPPKDEVDQKRDEALRRMLSTPHKPHTQPKKARATKKKAARKS